MDIWERQVISVPLPQGSSTRLRMMPPGRPDSRSTSVIGRADTLFDEAFIAVAHNHASRGLLALLIGLAEIRSSADRQQWRRISDEVWPRHPLAMQLRDAQIRMLVMRVGGPRSGLSALLSLLAEHAPQPAGGRR